MKRLFVVAAFSSSLLTALHAEDWPQWLGPKADSIWREEGILEKFPEGGPRKLWQAPIGAGYSGPAVKNGKVYVTDRQQTAANPANPFARATIPGTERVLCLDEKTGKILWKHEYDCPYTVSYPAGPRANPLVDENRVYTLGTEGHLICLDTATGSVEWQKDFKKEYGIETPVWGFSASPVLDGPRLICLAGGQGSTVVAYDKKSGRELWRALSSKEPGYATPAFVEVNGKRVLVVWTPEHVNALEPESGKVLWSYPWAIQQGLSVASPRQAGDKLFLSAFYQGPLMLRLASGAAGVEMLWKGKKSSEKDTTGLHALMTTPFLEGDHIYGVCTYGQFRCLNAATGERVWETFAPTGGAEVRWATAFIVKNGDRFFLPNEKGELIIAKLSPAGYQEISRATLLEPTNKAAGRDVVWSHPAFANKNIYARNDREIVAFSLAKPAAP